MDFEQCGFIGKEIESMSEEIYIKYKDIFNYLYELNKFAMKVLSISKVHYENIQEHIAICLFIKLINSTQSIYLLSNRGLESDANIILRCAIENLFILKAVCEDKNIAEDYVKSSEAKRLQLMKKILKDSYRTYPDTLKKDLDDCEIKDLENKIKDERIKQIRVWEFANKSNLRVFYDYAYGLLSDEVHSNIRSLNRYIEVDKDNNIVANIYQPMIEEVYRILDTAIFMIFISCESIGNVFMLDIEKEINKYQQIYIPIREKYLNIEREKLKHMLVK